MSVYENYIKKNKKVGNFGIGYLDRKLCGILQSDLVLIGARSGAGKSTISNIIAMANTESNVALFSLENFDGDDFMKECYYFYMKLSRNYKINMRAFVSGQVEVDKVIIKEAEKLATEKLKHIKIINRSNKYNLQKLKDKMISLAVNDGIKLLIIDHLDYLDKTNERTSDVVHISELMSTIREIQGKTNCAVVAISHLRKPAGGNKEAPVVPSMDEFIGSSTKTKESTVVIMMAPDDEENQQRVGNPLKATFCCIRKLRNGGIDNTTARLEFNIRTGNYSNDEDIYRINYSGTKIEKVENDRM